MTHHYIRAKSLAAVLTPLLSGALVLTGMTVSAHAGTENRSDTTGTYVVKLADAPVAAYDGGLRGLKRTMPASGKRLDPASSASREYVRRLDARRDRVLDAVPGATKLYDYDYTFNGFAARLTAGQAAELTRTAGVVSVTRSTVTRPEPAPEPAPAADSGPAAVGKGTAPRSSASGRAAAAPASPPDVPRFLGLSGKKGLWSKLGGPRHAGEGMIVGVIDAVDPKNPMLAAMPEPRPDAAVIARKWHGTCDKGDPADPAHQVSCNNKVIGAAYFRAELTDPQPIDVRSALDMHSHGTHIGTTIAGDYDTPVSIPGTNVRGRLSGLAPQARLAFYKTCWSFGCGEADSLAAIDRAVADGVDVISFSIGGGLTGPANREAMFNAAKAGVFVAAAAGNEGPDTVGNTSPWVTTVAAESHDTDYRATLVLGNGRRITGPAFSEGIPKAPLVYAANAGLPGAEEAEFCAPDTLDADRVRGKIVICDRGGSAAFEYQDRLDELKKAGAVAMVLANTPTSSQDVFAEPTFPTFVVGPRDGKAVKEYAAAKGATARFTATVSTRVEAPSVAAFSSSGPDPASGGDLLKPDIAAPGQLIAAGTVPGGFAGYKGSFGFWEGTSMATPHIAGLATLLKQLHPDWSPMGIKSALMTTATTTDNEGRPITRQTDTAGKTVPATPLDYGAGSPRVTRAADPGLVYDSTSADWTAYLCAVGVEPPTAGACATAPETDPSDLNYPTISVGDVFIRQTVTRTVTNVSSETATYRATLHTPPGYTAKVTPRTLTVAPGAKATYKVAFTRTHAAYDSWRFGTLTWSDTHSAHRVRSQISLRAARLSVPDELTVTGGKTTVALATRIGWTGRLTATTTGLYAGEKHTGTLTGVDKEGHAEAPPSESGAIKKVRVHVPRDTRLARVAVFSSDHLRGSDLDLFVYDKDGKQVSPSPVEGSDEHADLPPGDYDAYVVQYALPDGTRSQQFTLWTWQLGKSAPDVPATVTPASQQVGTDNRARVTVTWQGTEAGRRYLGLVEYGDGSTGVGRTALTVAP